MNVCRKISDGYCCGTDENATEHQSSYVEVVSEKAGTDAERAGHASGHAHRPWRLLITTAEVAHKFT